MAAISVNDYLKIHKRSPLGCRIESFLIICALQNATYQVVVMTIDKFIAIQWPHKGIVLQEEPNGQ